MPIPLSARAPIPFTPPALANRNREENVAREARGEKPLEPVKIIIRVPTMYERDSFASALVRGGVVNYSRRQIREMMLAGVAYLRPKEDFDELQERLAQLWAWEDAQKKCENDRMDRYAALQEENAQLPVKQRLTEQQIQDQVATIRPDVEMREADRISINAIQQDVMARYEPMMRCFADMAEHETQRRWICVETYVVNWQGLEHTPEGNGHGGIERREAEWLRAQIGGEAFDQLADLIFAMHWIDGDEEKNLASLIESSSALTGSTQQETKPAQDAAGGNSMGTSTTKTRATASRKTTGSSSGRGKRSGTRTAASGSSPTAAG